MLYDLIAVGSATKDIILTTDRGKIFRTPKNKLAPKWLGFELGEKICVNNAVKNIGGVAANVAIGTKKLGLNSTLITTLGRDSHKNWVVKELKKHKVDVSLIKINFQRESPLSTILVDQKTGERIIFYEKSSGEIDLSNLGKIKSKWFCVSSLTGDWSKQSEKILGVVKKQKASLILAPSTSQIIDGFVDLKKMLKWSKIILLNYNEALEIAAKLKLPAKDIKDLVKILHKLGPKVVCLTDGINGAYASNNSGILHCPASKVKVIDTTGAGDAFMSGFLGFFLKNKSLGESLKAGIANSASVVRYTGTTKGLLTQKEILKKIKSLEAKEI